MATRSAGRVTIRVIPDSTGFRRDLKTALERVERTTKAQIPAELVVTRESLTKLQAQLRDLSVRIKVEPYVTNEDIHDLKKKIEDVDPDVRVGLNTGVARARLATLTRDREVKIFVKVNQASLKAAQASLLALSGARLLGSVFDDFWSSIKNLDKSAPRIAAISSGFIGLAGILGAAVSNMSGLALSFAQLGQSAVLIPALLSGAAISIGVLIAALKDMKTVLKDLGPQFTNLQDIISKNFWDQAAQPIRNLVNNLMPTLNDQLGQIASSWGNLFATLANSLQATVTPDRLVFMMQNLKRSIDIASRAVDPLVQAFVRLGEFGSNYLPRLSEWLVKLSNQFNNFIQGAANDGRLEKWAETGIQAFKDLGKVIYQTARVFGALARAAEAAGGASFAILADGLKKLADTMNTANFQTTFITILASAHRVVDGLIDGLNRLGPGLANFAPTIALSFAEVGKILGQLGEDLGELMKSPALQGGLVRLFSGFLTFVTDLKPAMAPLGEILGTIGDIMGTFLSNFGPVIAALATGLAPVFTEVWNALKPLVPVLSDLLIELIPPLAEILMVLAKEILPPLVEILKKVAPGFAELVRQITPEVVKFIKEFAVGLREFNAEIKVEDVINFAREIGNLIRTIETFLNTASSPQKTIEWLNSEDVKRMNESVNTELANFWKSVGDNITNFNNTVNGTLDTFWSDVHRGFQSITTEGPVWSAFWSTVASVVNTYMPGLGPVVSAGITTISSAIRGISTLMPGWTTFWNSLTNPVQLAFVLVSNTVTGGIGSVTIRMITGMVGVLANWAGHWPRLIPTVVAALAGVAGSVSGGFPAILSSIIGGMISVGVQFARGWQSVVGEIPGWFGRIGAGISAGIATAVGIMMGLPGRMLGAIAGASARFFSAGAALLGDFARGITSGIAGAVGAVGAAISRIRDLLPGSPAKVGPLSGQGWTKIRGQHMIEDMAQGMRERTGLLQTAAYDAASAMQLNASGMSWASDGSASGTSNAGALVNIEGDYYGATPEQVSDDFDKRIRRANTVYKLTGVK